MSDIDPPAEHAATFQAPEVEEVALLFPAYEIHGLIACGGMGAVYQGTQRSLDRVAAIKILPLEFSTDEEFRTGFESEAKAMAKLNHPNLIGVYDFGEAGGMLYIIMEFVAGNSLFESTNGQAIDQTDALRIVSEVCAGLEHAHSHGILHRDIKPANILLDANASPKIGDFGLARALESQIQEGEQIFGTPGYTAPEVLEPPFTFDQRADVFSVGVMLHEILTGKLPDSDPRPASQLSSCNPKLDAVIKKATDPDPTKRYSTAAELAVALDKIAAMPQSALLTNVPSAAAKKIYTPPTYKKKSSSGTFFFIFLLLAGAGAAYFYLNKDKGAPDKVESLTDNSTETVEINPVTAPKATDPAPAPGLTPKVSAPDAAEFEVEAFLQESRDSIAEKITPFTEKADSDIEAATKSYGREVGALIGKLDEVFRTYAEKQLMLEAAKWEAGSFRIPEVIPEELGIAPGAPELHNQYFEKQTAILATEAEGIQSQSGAYLTILEDQIAQLKEQGGREAEITEIQAEISQVKSQEGYFLSLFEE